MDLPASDVGYRQCYQCGKVIGKGNQWKDSMGRSFHKKCRAKRPDSIASPVCSSSINNQRSAADSDPAVKPLGKRHICTVIDYCAGLAGSFAGLAAGAWIAAGGVYMLQRMMGYGSDESFPFSLFRE